MHEIIHDCVYVLYNRVLNLVMETVSLTIQCSPSSMLGKMTYLREALFVSESDF